MSQRNNFWPFVGGLLVGAVALKTIENYRERQRELKENFKHVKTKEEIEIEEEISMVEYMINELNLKQYRTQTDNKVIDSLRNKLRKLRDEQETNNR